MREDAGSGEILNREQNEINAFIFLIDMCDGLKELHHDGSTARGVYE